MGLFKKKTMEQKLQKSKKNYAGELLDKLDKNGKLPFGWYAHNSHIVKPYEDKMVKTAVDLKKYKDMDRIKHLEKLIKQYNDFKKFCYKKGPCFKKYFQDQWEHCHNSRNKDFEYITPYVEELKELKKKK